MSDSDLIFINGINAASGDYDFPPLPLEDLSKLAQGEKFSEEELNDLRNKNAEKTQAHWAVKEGVDPKDLAQTGWGIVFAFSDKDKIPAIKDALKPLLDWRRSQAARIKENRYQEYIGPKAYRSKETKDAFLSRHGAGPGPADPDKVPYYLLLVGDPEAIPYRVQYQLDVQYAVGRLHFDNVEDYAKYAHNVVLAEQQARFLGRNMTFFGVANPDDAATQMSAKSLLTPLAAQLAPEHPNWNFKSYTPDQSTKATLGSILNNDADKSGLLMTASHGMGFPLNHELQLKHQGALLCQDWPGPRNHKGAIPQDFYFSGDDLTSNANLLGMIAFIFACYGGGTPQLDEFAHKDGKRAQIAPNAFVANLPRRMLQQGALACIGHVERAWGTSFMWGGKEQIEVFKSSLKRLLDGTPIGNSVEYFNERYAELSSDLSSYLEEISFGETPDNQRLVGMWTANNDSRSYVVIGDPAVRLPLADGAPAARPALSTTLAPIAVSAAPAGDSAPAALDDLTTQIQKGIKQTLEASSVQRETDVKTEPSDVSGSGGDLTGTAKLSTVARLDGKSAWDVEVTVTVKAKKK